MASGSGQFDIYQSAVGVTAVTNPVQRQILDALSEGVLQLPEIVELTGKAKSTLSSIHMKELLNRELIAEEPHPTDSRRKIYRLTGTPMRSGDASALQRALPNAPASSGISLAEVVRILCLADHDSMERQGRALGQRFASRMAAQSRSDFARALSRFVEEERLASHLQLDFEALSFRCLPGPALAEVEVFHVGLLLAAIAEGAASVHKLAPLSLQVEVDGPAFCIAPA